MTSNETDPTVERIRVLMARKGWSQNATARFLGTPTGTFGNWMQGTKKPSKVVGRLLDVLGMVEFAAPQVYANLMDAAQPPQRAQQGPSDG